MAQATATGDSGGVELVTSHSPFSRPGPWIVPRPQADRIHPWVLNPYVAVDISSGRSQMYQEPWIIKFQLEYPHDLK